MKIVWICFARYSSTAISSQVKRAWQWTYNLECSPSHRKKKILSSFSIKSTIALLTVQVLLSVMNQPLVALSKQLMLKYSIQSTAYYNIYLLHNQITVHTLGAKIFIMYRIFGSQYIKKGD